MIGARITVNTKAAEALNRSLRAFSATMGKAVAAAPRIAAMGICDSLRAQTKKAPKTARSNEYRIVRPHASGFVKVGNRKVPSPAPYVTYKDKRRLPLALRRYELTTRLGTEKERTRIVYPYAHIRHSKSGGIVTDAAAEKREIRAIHLRIGRAGLARRSWNWIKQAIYNGMKPTVLERNRKARNPVDSVDGRYSANRSTAGVKAYAKIVNHLDYIDKAVKSSAVDEALRRTAKSLAYKAAIRERMTPEDAAKYARGLLSEYERPQSAPSSVEG